MKEQPNNVMKKNINNRFFNLKKKGGKNLYQSLNSNFCRKLHQKLPESSLHF